MNVPLSTNPSELREIFSQFGHLLSVAIGEKDGMGFGFVYYSSMLAIDQAASTLGKYITIGNVKCRMVKVPSRDNRKTITTAQVVSANRTKKKRRFINFFSHQ
jgi:RNA recognition motif-containing protein